VTDEVRTQLRGGPVLSITVGGIPGAGSTNAFWIVTGSLGLLALVEPVIIWRMRLF